MSLEKEGLIPRFEGHQKDCLAEITLATLRLVQNNPKRFSWLMFFFFFWWVLLLMYHFKTGEAKPYGTFCWYYSVSYPSISRNVLTERVSVHCHHQTATPPGASAVHAGAVVAYSTPSNAGESTNYKHKGQSLHQRIDTCLHTSEFSRYSTCWLTESLVLHLLHLLRLASVFRFCACEETDLCRMHFVFKWFEFPEGQFEVWYVMYVFSSPQMLFIMTCEWQVTCICM